MPATATASTAKASRSRGKQQEGARSPLTPQDWVQSAIVLLTDRGIDSVRVDVLAKILGVTRGSFYWHFKDRDDLLKSEMEVERTNWISIAAPEAPMRVSIKIRSRAEEAGGTITTARDGSVRVYFDEPQRAVTPGQAAVFYDGDIVVGGGWIVA